MIVPKHLAATPIYSLWSIMLRNNSAIPGGIFNPTPSTVCLVKYMSATWPVTELLKESYMMLDEVNMKVHTVSGKKFLHREACWVRIFHCWESISIVAFAKKCSQHTLLWIPYNIVRKWWDTVCFFWTKYSTTPQMSKTNVVSVKRLQRKPFHFGISKPTWTVLCHFSCLLQ
jgi:hypothetical protein